MKHLINLLFFAFIGITFFSCGSTPKQESKQQEVQVENLDEVEDVDDEVIDEQRLAGFLTGLGKFGLAGEAVDQTRLAHITPADECILRQRCLR